MMYYLKKNNKDNSNKKILKPAATQTRRTSNIIYMSAGYLSDMYHSFSTQLSVYIWGIILDIPNEIHIHIQYFICICKVNTSILILEGKRI